MTVKFHKNCENTAKILKISCVRFSYEVILKFSRDPIRNFLGVITDD